MYGEGTDAGRATLNFRFGSIVQILHRQPTMKYEVSITYYLNPRYWMLITDIFEY